LGAAPSEFFRSLLVLALSLSLGCAATAQCPAQVADARNRCSNGIPNFHAVEEAKPHRHLIYRGGQPTLEGWAYLRDTIHVTTVVKLNAPEESWNQGEDQPAAQLGMRVVSLSLPPHDYGVALKSVVDLLRDLPEDKVATAIATLADDNHGNVYVHCTHGRDRTGLVVGLYRVFRDGWSAKDAYAEMNTEGFRPINHNLHEYWEGLFEHPEQAESIQHRAHLQALVDQVSKPVSP
jgi:hypothetical protein